jgi:hypothetical protein
VDRFVNPVAAGVDNDGAQAGRDVGVLLFALLFGGVEQVDFVERQRRSQLHFQRPHRGGWRQAGSVTLPGATCEGLETWNLGAGLSERHGGRALEHVAVDAKT